MKNIEEIQLVRAYITIDKQIVLIEESDLQDLLSKFDNIDLVPPNIKLSVRLLVPEPSNSQVGKIIVYQKDKSVEIDNLNAIEEHFVRCSDFSIYR